MIICSSCQYSNEEHYKFCLSCGGEIVAMEADEDGADGSSDSSVRSSSSFKKPLDLRQRLEALRAGRAHPKAVSAAPSEPVVRVSSPPEGQAVEPQDEPGVDESAFQSDGEGESMGAESSPSADGELQTDVGSGSVDAENSVDGSVKESEQIEQANAGRSELESLIEASAAADSASEPGAGGSEFLFSSLGETQLSIDALKDGPLDEGEETGAAESAPSEVAETPNAQDDDFPTVVSPVVVDHESVLTCRACSTSVPVSFKFCGVCGTSTASDEGDTVLSVETTRSLQLVLIRADGSEGESFPIEDGTTVIGRDHEATLFSGDPFLSPRHATINVSDGQVTVGVEDSLNGVYLRIYEQVAIVHGHLFRLGQQLLRFEQLSNDCEPPEGGDGTLEFGSPSEGIWGRLVEVMGLDRVGQAWTLHTPEVFLGREQASIVFAQDAYMSSSHCRIARQESGAVLEDLNSTNGTFLKMDESFELSVGDLVLLGQQVFRLDILG